MNILFIGKFPPIEGGVSAQTYWLARSLAKGGHSVHVVTNAREIEPTFAQLHYGNDGDWLRLRHGRAVLQIHQTTPLEPWSYIPFAQPHVTKLFGLALSVIEKHKIDVILSWYFEPYGFVAALVGKATKRPFFVRHAGSDIGRLARHPQLKRAYRWMLGRATGLSVTNERELKTELGVISRPRLRLNRPRLPEIFSDSEGRLDVDELVRASRKWFGSAGLDQHVMKKIQRLNEKSLTSNAFTIGVYGKVGTTKGSFDLIKALAKVSGRRLEFQFLTISCGSPDALRRYYELILSSRSLAARSLVLPPIAPWRIPSFLKRCDVVCFLERDFPISFHGPLIPREILSSGACLVCSAEIAGKPFYRGNLVDDRNAIIIRDPTNHDVLAKRIAGLVTDRNRTKAIGQQGQKLGRFWDDDLLSFETATETLATNVQQLMLRGTNRSSAR